MATLSAALSAMVIITLALPIDAQAQGQAQGQSVVQSLSEFHVYDTRKPDVFPEALELSGGRRLVLNGSGLRKFGLLGIQVYYGALYLERRDQRPEAILESSGQKAVVMRTLRSIDRDQSRDAIRENIERSCKPPCTLPQASLLELLKTTPDARARETQVILFGPDGRISVHHQGQKIGELVDPRLAKILLSTWIGPAPVSEPLKQGMLGLSKP